MVCNTAGVWILAVSLVFISHAIKPFFFPSSLKLHKVNFKIAKKMMGNEHPS